MSVLKRHALKLFVFAAFLAAFLSGFYVHETTIPARSQDYVQGFLDRWKQTPSSSSQLGDTASQLGNAPSQLGDAPSQLGDAPSQLGDAPPQPEEQQDSQQESVYSSSDKTVSSDTAKETETSSNKTDDHYVSGKWFFQEDQPFELPQFDVAKLRTYAPRHHNGGPGQTRAFALVYVSRDASLRDPYFLACMSIVYRLLWAPASRTFSHPIIVFVGSFVPDEQRAYFEAAGAIVRETPDRPFIPNKEMIPERLKDMFSKLDMWNQTDFDRIAYLDSDAFPLANIDPILADETVPAQKCNSQLLSVSDAQDSRAICDYSFGAVREKTGMMNAGVIVLQPNAAMHSVLMDEYHDGKHFDNGLLEQALISYVFRDNGPFPATRLGAEWNGPPSQRDDGGKLFILHGKIWAPFQKPEHWSALIWDETWNDMLQLYENPAFETIRAQDHARAHPHEHSGDISKWQLDTGEGKRVRRQF